MWFAVRVAVAPPLRVNDGHFGIVGSATCCSCPWWCSAGPAVVYSACGMDDRHNFSRLGAFQRWGSALDGATVGVIRGQRRVQPSMEVTLAVAFATSTLSDCPSTHCAARQGGGRASLSTSKKAAALLTRAISLRHTSGYVGRSFLLIQMLTLTTFPPFYASLCLFAAAAHSTDIDP